jgi:hypothetical protein
MTHIHTRRVMRSGLGRPSLCLSIDGDGRLLNADGRPARRSDVSDLQLKGHIVLTGRAGDVEHWRTGDGGTRFRVWRAGPGMFGEAGDLMGRVVGGTKSEPKTDKRKAAAACA